MNRSDGVRRARRWGGAAVLVLLAVTAWSALAAPRRGAAVPARSARPAAGRAVADTAFERAIVRYLADPAREGRGVGTAGLDSAAAFIEGQMRRLGLEPGGDSGGFRQMLEVTTGAQAIAPCALEVGGKRFDLGETFQPLGFSTNGTLRAPVVFAGYGITAPGYDYDDYAGVDVHDKLVLVMTNEPGEMDSTSRFDGSVNTPHAELRTKAINAREHGALGLLVVNGPRYHAGEPLRKPRAEGSGVRQRRWPHRWTALLGARHGRALPADSLVPGCRQRHDAPHHPAGWAHPGRDEFGGGYGRTHSI